MQGKVWTLPSKLRRKEVKNVPKLLFLSTVNVVHFLMQLYIYVTVTTHEILYSDHVKINVFYDGNFRLTTAGGLEIAKDAVDSFLPTLLKFNTLVNHKIYCTVIKLSSQRFEVTKFKYKMRYQLKCVFTHLYSV